MSLNLAYGAAPEPQKISSLRHREQPSTLVPRRLRTEEPVPLSYLQEPLWRSENDHPGTSAHHLSRALHLRGPLDLAALTRDLRRVVERHHTLRTTFATLDARVRQIVSPTLAHLPWVDLESLAPADRRRVTRQIARNEARRSFTPARAPLMRACLLRLASEEHCLLFTAHQLVFDEWSLGILLYELSENYRADLAGQAYTLAALPVQLADLIVWQHSLGFDQQTLTELRLHSRALSALEPVDLPGDRQRPAKPSLAGGWRSRRFDAYLGAGVARLAAAYSASSYMTLLAAWGALLHRLTGQNMLPLCAPFADRGRPEADRLIGCLTNTLVLQLDVAGDPAAPALIAGVRDAVFDALERAHLPFSKLLSTIAESDTSYEGELTRVSFVYQNAVLEPLDLGEFTFSRLEAIDPEQIEQDLALSLIVRGSELTARLGYSKDLFDRTTAERLLRQFEALLRAMVQHPEQQLSALELLSDGERHQLMTEWNDTATNHIATPELARQDSVSLETVSLETVSLDSTSATLNALFKHQTRRTPDAIALLFDSVEGSSHALSYRELERRAARLAKRLMHAGVVTDRLVGVALERSLEMVIALLGTLEAGGAWVPLDPSLPSERLAFMVEDGLGHDGILLTHSSLLDRLPRRQTAVLLVDVKGTGAEKKKTKTLSPPTLTPDNLAYMIYTSGSTGQPKGAMNSHRGIVNRLRWMQTTRGIGSDDRVMQKTPYSFDVSVWEFFWPLLAGAQLVIARPEGHKDGSYLTRLIRESRVTTMHFVPSMLQIFLEGDVDSCTSLDRVIASGEALSEDLQQRFFARMPAKTQLHNLYGPTEAAVEVTSWPCRNGCRVAIGQPVDNTRLQVLDPHLKPVAVGVPGQLLLSGVQLARGYWQRPALTAERFIPDPYGPAGSRMYQTGDLVRWRRDGRVAYLGRLDFQVKVRGFRIELGEIAARLMQHQAIREAVVLARTDLRQDGDPRLVAYLVDEQKALPTLAELRDFLTITLPEYMVPTAWVILEDLPLSPSGKIDRRALPKPHQQTDFVAPRNEVERLLAVLWQELLEVDEIGVHDHFFELGGHSLHANRHAYRLREWFGIDFSLRLLFEQPTIAELAPVIEGLGWQALGRSDEPGSTADLSVHLRQAQQRAVMQAIPVHGARRAPLGWFQETFWFIEQQEQGRSVYRVPLEIVLYGALDTAHLDQAFADLTERQTQLRTRFDVDEEGCTFQQLQPSAPFSQPLVDLSHLRMEDREPARREAIATFMTLPFDLAAGSLMKTLLLRASREQHHQIFNLHHIISDAWSVPVLLRDLAAFYNAQHAERAAELEPLPVQFADYAAWEREQLQGENLARQMEYWAEKLGGSLPQIELLSDRPRPAEPSHHGALCTTVIPAPLLKRLEQRGREDNASLFMTLITGYKVMLGRHARERRITLGTPVANRVRAEVEQLVGCFTSMTVLTTDLDGDPTLREALARVRETALGAFAHQEMPFFLLLANFPPENFAFDRSPIQAVFTLHNAAPPRLDLDGLDTVLGEPINPGTADIDLDLFAQEKDGDLHIELTYNSDLFDHETVVRWLEEWGEVLQVLANRPETRLSQVSCNCMEFLNF